MADATSAATEPTRLYTFVDPSGIAVEVAVRGIVSAIESEVGRKSAIGTIVANGKGMLADRRFSGWHLRVEGTP